jgi:hypothetical protein
MSTGDAGEGLVDAESRLAERMEEREQEKRRARLGAKGDPERTRQAESLRLARTELQRQLEVTTHEARRKQIGEAIAELERRMSQLRQS